MVQDGAIIDPLGQPTDYVLGWKRVGVGLAPSLFGLAVYGIGLLTGLWEYGPGLFPAFIVWVFASALAPHAYIRRRTAFALGVGLAIPSLAAVLAMNFGVVQIDGASMEPTLFPGDSLLIDEKAEPEAGGLYVLEVSGENNPLIKRIVGVPGQKLEFRLGRVFADGVEMYPRTGDPAEYATERPVEDFNGTVNLGEDEYFVLGDNPTQSRDSRRFGTVKAEAFKGRVAWSLKGSRGFGPVR
jgi:signal peptidase I